MRCVMNVSEVVDEVIREFASFEYWNPWHEFKFAEARGFNMTFFLPAVGMALRSINPQGDPPRFGSESSLELLSALRKRARELSGLPDPTPDISDSWQSFLTDPSFFTYIRGATKAAGDIRRFTPVEISETAERIRRDYRDVVTVIKISTRHNFEVNPNFVADGKLDINDYRIVDDIICLIIAKIFPNLDRIDNSKLMRGVYNYFRDEAIGEAL
jgi:hypothetical protein